MARVAKWRQRSRRVIVTMNELEYAAFLGHLANEKGERPSEGEFMRRHCAYLFRGDHSEEWLATERRIRRGGKARA